jgi:hypothetical protein
MAEIERPLGNDAVTRTATLTAGDRQEPPERVFATQRGLVSIGPAATASISNGIDTRELGSASIVACRSSRH